jgi:hypothetical protein
MITNDPAIIAHIKSTFSEYERITDAMLEAAKEYGTFRSEAYAAAEKPEGWSQYDNPYPWGEPLDPCSHGRSSFEGIEETTDTYIYLSWQDYERDTFGMYLTFEYLALDTEGRREYARQEIERRIASKQASKEAKAAEEEAKDRAKLAELQAKFGTPAE